MIKEKVCKFNYPFEYIEEKDALKEILKSHAIRFICYESNGGWPHQFVVMRSGKAWNDIYKLINSVKSARYKLETVCLTDDRSKEVIADIIHE